MDDPILGAAQFDGEFDRVKVKGNLVASRARYMREQHGEKGLQHLARSLSGEALRYLTHPPLPSSWWPLRPLIELDRQIVLGPMEGRVERMREFGREIAGYDLTTLYKVLFKAGSPSFIVKRMGIAYSTYIQGGELTSLAEETRADVELTGVVLPRYLCAEGISGWLMMAAEKSGARAIKVNHTSCRHEGHAACRWKMDWV